MLNEALDLLKNQYEQTKEEVAGQEFYEMYCNEKWRHSMQVFGAGNYLVRRIKWLKNKPAEYVEMVKTAILLHDVCRFKEISYLAQGKKIDHGVEGAKFLHQTELFNDIRICLPIKHHGHLIEMLYADEQYQNLPKDLQKEVELICFIIRDADKIANLHMLAYESDMRSLFFGEGTGDEKKDYSISDFAKEDAFSGLTVRRTPECTIADRMLGYLSWFNDINYRHSVDFCLKLRIIEILKNLFAQICNDKEFVQKYFAYFDECLRDRAFLD